MLWTLSPDWSGSYSVTRRYKTEIFVSDSGREQRRSLDKMPRRSIEFTVTAWADKFRALNRRLWAMQPVMFAMPDYSRYAVQATGSTPGQTSISVKVVPPWLRSGATVMLGDGDIRESLLVDHVTSLTVYFTTALAFTHGANTRLRFGARGRLATEIQLSKKTNGDGTGRITFDETPGTATYVYPPDAPVIYAGREVFLFKPNWGNEVSVTTRRERDTVDYEFGVTDTFVPVTFSTRLFSATYLSLSRERMELIEDVFDRCRGQCGEFYMPTWENDLPLAATVAVNGTALHIAGRDVYDAYHDDGVNQAVYVAMRDGRTFYRQVESIVYVGGDSVVSLTDGVPYEISPATVLMISWMPVCRFASDNMTTEWLAEDIGQSKIVFQTLEALPAE